MNRISTHVLDTGSGKPASGVPVHLERQDSAGKRVRVGSGQTDQDGRCNQLLPAGELLHEGSYCLTFETGTYYAARGIQGLYPVVEVTFQVRDGESQFHIPVLLSANAYTTYRGS
jgi:5-hydroxyisourate hydrolase